MRAPSPSVGGSSSSRRRSDGPVRSHKVVFLGQSGTGKTSIIRQFVYRTYDQCYQATVGMDFVSKLLNGEAGRKPIRLQLWDTAGQERFRALIPGYLRDSSACILVYDITSRQSFESIRSWAEQALEGRSSKDVVMALVGNKLDLEAQREVSYQEGEALAKELSFKLFFEASARTADLVDAVFHGLAEVLPSEVPKKAESDDEIILEPPRRLQAVGQPPTSKKQCC
ncbi:unnamed protein product [Polarella glacialis]|uniref:Uncharacterized protein n=1 Tax=Polarella glacialis TaxID=89957 RepID=A0A813DRC2_POLGL|nr:unnamed protein product [Polarella glacialis]